MSINYEQACLANQRGSDKERDHQQSTCSNTTDLSSDDFQQAFVSHVITLHAHTHGKHVQHGSADTPSPLRDHSALLHPLIMHVFMSEMEREAFTFGTDLNWENSFFLNQIACYSKACYAKDFFFHTLNLDFGERKKQLYHQLMENSPAGRSHCSSDCLSWSSSKQLHTCANQDTGRWRKSRLQQVYHYWH